MKAAKKPSTPSRQASAAPPGQVARLWLLAALVAVCVGRPLLPSEGVSWIGDGQPFNLLTLAIAAGTLLTALLAGGLPRRMGPVDWAVAALVGIMALSALASITPLGRLPAEGSPRHAINMLWEWIGLGLIYFLARQLIDTSRVARAVAAAMVALAVVLSGFGFYQVLVSLPEGRAEYARNPDEVLRSVGQWSPPGSPERQRFESRLNSTEPLATFALTNSLAGYLAPWLIVALGIGALWWMSPPATSGDTSNRALTLARAAGYALALVAMLTCLVLTKSRSGYVALAAGLCLLPWALGRAGRLPKPRILLAGGSVIAVIVGGAIALGGLDRQVMTEAGKSLAYRWEYWQATLAMIGRFPLLGVGPGNFQDFYTQFKLPQASEEVRDPHNFLLEVWATGGTLAAVALVVALGLLAWRVARTPLSPVVTEGASNTSLPSQSKRPAVFALAGAAAGPLLAFLLGPPVGLVFAEGQLLAALLIGGAAVLLMWPWILNGTLTARLPLVGVLVLAISLLAAGGIAFPGVAGSLWLLAAIALNLSEGELSAPSHGPRARWAMWTGLSLVACGTVACYLTAYAPVLSARAAMTRADALEAATDARVNAYLEAASGDPLSAEPWRAVAEIEIARLKQDPAKADTHARFVKATEKILALRPHSASLWREVGQWYRQLYERGKNPQAAETAAQALRNAADLYPNSPVIRAELALALADTAGKSASNAARRHAERALALDEATPHADKKLPEEIKKQLRDLIDRGKRGPS